MWQNLNESPLLARIRFSFWVFLILIFLITNFEKKFKFLFFNYEVLLLFCALDMAPTYAVPGLLSILPNIFLKTAFFRYYVSFFKFVFIEAPPRLLPETKNSASIENCLEFSALCDLQESFIEKKAYFFLHFFCFSRRFQISKIDFWCFQLGKSGFRVLCVSIRVFLPLQT